MSADEKIRVSGETPRATTPVLPTVNPGLEKSKPAGAGIHPTFYVIAWIGFSSSVILFNKWLLDTLNFRTFSPRSRHSICGSLTDFGYFQATPSFSRLTT
jgi:hypothetical protein